MWTSHLFQDQVNSVFTMATHSTEVAQKEKEKEKLNESVCGREICVIQSWDYQNGERMMQKILALCAGCCWHPYQNQLTVESLVVIESEESPANNQREHVRGSLCLCRLHS